MATETQETTTITERQAVERERAAFREGFDVGRCTPTADKEAMARRWYPSPKVTRPRVVRDAAGCEFRISTKDDLFGDGYIMFRGGNDCERWRAIGPGASMASVGITLSRAALIADLLANPTEEVTP